MIKVSVLIPSLNSESYIRQCLESVCNQSLKDIEIICIDAGSSDDTLNILNEFSKRDSRIKIINSDKKSYGYQMNLGLDNANGQYIGVVESDDFVNEKMYEKLFYLTSNGEMDIVKGNFYHYYDDSDIRIDRDKPGLEDCINPFKLTDYPIFLRGHPSIWAGIYNKEFLSKNDITFLEEPGAGWVDNPFFFETSFKAEKIAYVPNPFYYYRETNIDSSTNNLKDLSIPFRRMIDNLEIVDKSNCSDYEVLRVVYFRAFAYLKNIYESEDYKANEEFLRPYIHKMMLMMDEEIVLPLGMRMRKFYYEFASPMKLIKKDENITISKEDYDLLVKENDYLYSKIDELERSKDIYSSLYNRFKNKFEKSDVKNKNLKIKYKKLKKSDKKTKRELDTIKKSRSFLFGRYVSKVYNYIKRKFKR